MIRKYCSGTVVFGQEIGPVPIDDLPLGFLLGVDIELIEDHDLPVRRVVLRPLVRPAVGGLSRREGRIAGLCKLDVSLSLLEFLYAVLPLYF